MRFKLISLSLFAFLFSVNSFAQEEESVKKADPREAEKKLLSGNYDEALDDFLTLLNEDRNNDKYNYNVGVCYLNSHGNKTKALPYLEKVVHKEKHDPNAMFLLGRAYMFANRQDEALAAFNKFKATAKGSTENLQNVDLEIQYCLNAKELMKFPVNVKFENLGPKVNSEYNDHYAFIPIDESFIIYNTNRPEKDGIKQENGEYGNSIYFSEVKDGEYQKSYCMGVPISKGNSGEEIIGLSANGDAMLLYITNVKSGNIYLSEKDKNGVFKKPVMLDKNINTSMDEIAASMSSDGSTLFFASNRQGGLGGTDIYFSKRAPDGKWGMPVNCGPAINTNQNEDFPNISPDGNTLYFSSNGHTSMGGYDIFKVSRNPETGSWENAKNLGYPINTVDDDYNFRITKTERYGYLSCIRDGGLGDYDIYRVTFNDVEPELTVVHGSIKSADGEKINYPDVLMSVTNDVTGEIVGNYLPNPNTGQYVIILPPGKYHIEVELFGFKLLAQKLDIKDKVSYQSEMTLDLNLVH